LRADLLVERRRRRTAQTWRNILQPLENQVSRVDSLAMATPRFVRLNAEPWEKIECRSRHTSQGSNGSQPVDLSKKFFRATIRALARVADNKTGRDSTTARAPARLIHSRG